MPRSSKFIPRILHRLIEARNLGAPDRAMCAHAEIGTSTFHRWRQVRDEQQDELQGDMDAQADAAEAFACWFDQWRGYAHDHDVPKEPRFAHWAFWERLTRAKDRAHVDLLMDMRRHSAGDHRATWRLLCAWYPKLYGESATIHHRHGGHDGEALVVRHNLLEMSAEQLRAFGQGLAEGSDDPDGA